MDIRYQLDLRYGAVITLGIDENDMPAYTTHLFGKLVQSGNVESDRELRHVIASAYRLMGRKINYSSRKFIRNAAGNMF